ncbi:MULTISPECIES: amino acid adenylation domain-containing protein [unclassified Nonomuraea]|uniref:amino acid adenylation domain-containing protein n=1 Tax=unclassified Nonomuraea TaxID=2593643 RepID=UPI0033FB41BF
MSLKEWNDTARPYPRDAVLPELFDAQAARTPDAPALTGGGRTLTYRELAGRADALARVLRRQGVRAGTPVALPVERSAEAVVGIWAVLKAGGAYVPLDPGDPAARLRELTRRLGVEHVVTRADRRPSLDARHVLPLDGPVPEAGPLPPKVASATDLAYVIFTSGSTGVPKAVAVPHRAAVRMATATDCAALGPDDVVVATTNPTFDVSCFEIFGAHLNGSHLVVPEPEALLSPPDLARELREHDATVMWLSAGLFHQLGFADPGMFSSLRYLVAGGDVLNPDCVRGVLAAGPPEHLVNGYGPTENGTFSTAHEMTGLPPDAERVPIGRPIANSTCYVLREDGSPCEPEEEGELYVGGDGVALGYMGDEERTAERFLPDPFLGGDARMYRTGDRAAWRPDGVLDFLGRLDRQVKISGHRVEIGEVESELAAHPEVREAAVTVRESGRGDRALVAWAVPWRRKEPRPFARRVRAFLRDRLPAFMVPGRVAVADELPLNSSGKIDTRALAGTGDQPPAGPADPPRGEVERCAAEVWAAVLGTPVESRADDFYELGGTSLQAVQIVTALRARPGMGGLPGPALVRALLDSTSLEAFAARIAALRSGADGGMESEPTVDLAWEARLDPGLRFGPADPAPPREILVTGATGFLGAFLVRRLLDVTDLRLSCLVRAADGADGLRRVGAALRRYGLPAADLGTRLTAVPGDLALPGLGLPQSELDGLADHTDVILHAAAQVNFVYPYSRLQDANVGGVRSLIRLAAHGGRARPFHHVSTVDVLAAADGPPTGGRVREDDPLPRPERLRQGYAETKWVAEALLGEAAGRGLPVALYRPYEITGSRDRGVWNTGTMMAAVIKAIAETGLAPDVPLRLDFVPVDYVAQAVVALLAGAPARGRVYHLANPRPAALPLLVERLRRQGYPVRVISREDWVREMERLCAADPAAPLAGYLTLLTGEEAADGSVTARQLTGALPEPDLTNLAEAVPDVPAACPPVDAGLLDLYIGWLRETGYLHQSTAAPRETHSPPGSRG